MVDEKNAAVLVVLDLVLLPLVGKDLVYDEADRSSPDGGTKERERSRRENGSMKPATIVIVTQHPASLAFDLMGSSSEANTLPEQHRNRFLIRMKVTSPENATEHVFPFFARFVPIENGPYQSTPWRNQPKVGKSSQTTYIPAYRMHKCYDINAHATNEILERIQKDQHHDVSKIRSR